MFSGNVYAVLSPVRVAILVSLLTMSISAVIMIVATHTIICSDLSVLIVVNGIVGRLLIKLAPIVHSCSKENGKVMLVNTVWHTASRGIALLDWRRLQWFCGPLMDDRRPSTSTKYSRFTLMLHMSVI